MLPINILQSLTCLLGPLYICRLVGGAGDIRLTKDGNTLLKEMVRHIQFSVIIDYVKYVGLVI